MKNYYNTLLLTLFLIGAMSLHAQEIIYDTTHTGTNAATSELINATDGPNTHFSDEFIIAGAARLVTSVSVDIVVDAGTENTPYDLTLSLHRNCPEGISCGSSSAFYVQGTEQTQTITPGTTAKQTITFEYPGIDVTTADDVLAVSLTANRSGVRWVRNEAAVVGSQNTTGDNMEPPSGFFSRCGSSVSDNNSCSFLYSVGTSVHAITVTATEALNADEFSLEQAIVASPNPVKNKVTVSYPNSINPTQAKIYDLNGRLVAQKYTYNIEYNFDMDMSNLSNGMYFLHFESEEGTIIKSLIKN